MRETMGVSFFGRGLRVMGSCGRYPWGAVRGEGRGSGGGGGGVCVGWGTRGDL